MAKVIPVCLCCMIFLIQCNDKNNTAPFADLLKRPPYSSLTDSILREPRRDDLYFHRAVMLNKNDLPEPALADFQKAWSLRKDEKYAMGISTLLMDKKPDSAILFLESALEELPGSFLLRLRLARSYDSQGKTREALSICDELLAKDPEQVDVLKLKADLLDKNGDQPGAVKILETAYLLTPYDFELNKSLAEKYAESSNAKVIRLCDSLIKVDSLNLHAEPWYFKGIYYSNISEHVKALAFFNEAIRHDYYFLPAYIEKGRVQYDQGKTREAMATFQLANTISATYPDAYFWMGKCEEAMGNKVEAKLNYQRAFALDKTFTEAREAANRLSN